MEPENDDFQKESPFPGADFQLPGEKLQGCKIFQHFFTQFFPMTGCLEGLRQERREACEDAGVH